MAWKKDVPAVLARHGIDPAAGEAAMSALEEARARLRDRLARITGAG